MLTTPGDRYDVVYFDAEILAMKTARTIGVDKGQRIQSTIAGEAKELSLRRLSEVVAADPASRLSSCRIPYELSVLARKAPTGDFSKNSDPPPKHAGKLSSEVVDLIPVEVKPQTAN